ncbi:tRNA (adenosine(37)-N6)-threonylcarbamoyltransferase complex ATPase subunit type 1 TsaE [Spirulina sp. CS-785/01]|uniref:tRNA (adenosine(37)-N6)-threonylcarbamoyltransferase complex ATPase subunit type 1 TsaE n=1 Tax=Spirulina sp. CS-785/01 TaxID=3021716 RepID=UPI00232BBE4A|nr:tRNA (adenosine(37)-N6)-threonylcarbamoyltransferase complex ATPase subunit type 1 TsaE [Spirulina sp. CS-785/01]MDB9315312.1 tRNA (adenosine(37)-N6)-threonylcarbamoyltransferase complex ATPase subunit type 1 TsaE [Spirulina sp. CS-785/01]
MNQETLILADTEATLALGRQLGQKLLPNTVLLLDGDLGAGKTTLIKGLGEGLGILDPILSPTFTLINEYSQGRLPLYHFDLYRLSPAEVAELTPELYWEGVEVPPGITAIEWSERLPYHPPHYWQISLKLTPDEGREAVIVSPLL